MGAHGGYAAMEATVSEILIDCMEKPCKVPTYSRKLSLLLQRIGTEDSAASHTQVDVFRLPVVWRF